jgi:hypothetical protein
MRKTRRKYEKRLLNKNESSSEVHNNNTTPIYRLHIVYITL